MTAARHTDRTGQVVMLKTIMTREERNSCINTLTWPTLQTKRSSGCCKQSVTSLVECTISLLFIYFKKNSIYSMYSNKWHHYNKHNICVINSHAHMAHQQLQQIVFSQLS